MRGRLRITRWATRAVALLALSGSGASRLPAQALVLDPRAPAPLPVVAGSIRTLAPLSSGLGFSLTAPGGAPATIRLDGLELPMALHHADGTALTVSQWSMVAVDAEGNASTHAPPPPAGSEFETLSGQLDLDFGFALTPSVAQTPGRYEGLVVLTASDTAAHTEAVTASTTLAVDVLAPLQTWTEPMTLGAFVAGTQVVFEPGHADAGQILVTGHPSTSVVLEFSAVPVALLGPGGASLPFTPLLLSGPEAAAPCASGTPIPVTAGTQVEFQLPTDGDRWLACLGATVNPDPSQSPGLYLATVSVTLHYVGS